MRRTAALIAVAVSLAACKPMQRDDLLGVWECKDSYSDYGSMLPRGSLFYLFGDRAYSEDGSFAFAGEFRLHRFGADHRPDGDFELETRLTGRWTFAQGTITHVFDTPSAAGLMIDGRPASVSESEAFARDYFAPALDFIAVQVVKDHDIDLGLRLATTAADGSGKVIPGSATCARPGAFSQLNRRQIAKGATRALGLN